MHGLGLGLARTHTFTHSHSFLQNNGWTNFQWNRLICFWDSHRNSVWCVSVQNMLFVKHFIYAETLNSSLFKTSDFKGLRTEWDTESHGRQQNETRMITRTTREQSNPCGASQSPIVRRIKKEQTYIRIDVKVSFLTRSASFFRWDKGIDETFQKMSHLWKSINNSLRYYK